MTTFASIMKRKASHAGSWYTEKKDALNAELDHWLKRVPGTVKDASGRKINLASIASRIAIVPHAGYAYSGPTAAYSYKSLKRENVKTVFILGPSHHSYLENCALTKSSEYDTPFGPLAVNTRIVNDLSNTSRFTYMSKSVDEDEHSIEMQLPFIYKIYGSSVSIVPILVGALSAEAEAEYGGIMAKYLQDAANVFLVSSDFCHWGRRFGYVYKASESLPIWESIEQLDRDGMRLVEKADPIEFRLYLKKTGNTICGRHPIAVLLHALQRVETSEGKPLLHCIHYDQSSRCQNFTDSSVSYVAAIGTC